MDIMLENEEAGVTESLLPEAIPDPTPQQAMTGEARGQEDLATINSAITGTQITAQPFFPIFKSLAQGCYLLHYTPLNNWFYDYYGTMRIERVGTNTIASGDLYSRRKFSLAWLPAEPAPSPSSGIPIFKRSSYIYYLRVTQILEWLTFGNSFTLGFQRYKYNQTTDAFSNEGTFTATMSWTTAPGAYPNSSQYLSGQLKNSSGVVQGTLTMGWVAPKLRKAIVEIDRVSQSEYPGNNGAGVDWNDVFQQVNWQMTAYSSHTNISEPSGNSWNSAELHAKMLVSRATSNLDNQWRYHLLCVRNLDMTSRGIMYDAYGSDSNNVPREGAALASHWVIPNTAQWGTVQGIRFGAADGPYFRTAVHEIAHAMGLYHNTADNGFMNTTGTIAASPGVFPSNIQWSFSPTDAKRLRHMPDPWVRPGMIPFGNAYSSAPISPNDDVVEAQGIDLTVTPLVDVVPLGAPVRVNLNMTNNCGVAVSVPAAIGLKSEFVSGIVVGPSGQKKSFRPVVRCIDEDNERILDAEDSITHDLTLLRGRDGALFSEPGMYSITVDINWEIDRLPLHVSGQCNVMVTPAIDEAHAAAACKVLSCPDLLLTLAIGGDHLEEGVAALTAAMDNSVLRPHYAVVEAKRIGNRFMERKADIKGALGLIDKECVMTACELKRIADMAATGSGKEREASAYKKCVDVLKKKATSLSVNKDLKQAVDDL